MNGLGSSWLVGPFPHIPSADPRGPFGSLVAIAPLFDAMAMAEQKAALALLEAAGEPLPAIAAALGRDPASIAALRDRRCPLIAVPGEADEMRSRVRVRMRPVAVQKRLLERSLDDALAAIDAVRAAQGQSVQSWFEMTLDTLCQACGLGHDAGKRRLKELESRKWIRRSVRAGRPPLVRIALAGRCRLEAAGTAARRRQAP
ncbi:MAG: hypothetical protein ACSHXI_07085 [Hoeflea sp.]|uniref:hypothetical protein n=1 Tax=Hoeflea sp. TaxID=1940281 RepID=UPI003EF32276